MEPAYLLEDHESYCPLSLRTPPESDLRLSLRVVHLHGYFSIARILFGVAQLRGHYIVADSYYTQKDNAESGQRI